MDWANYWRTQFERGNIVFYTQDEVQAAKKNEPITGIIPVAGSTTRPVFGSNGSQFTSKTVWRKENLRIDVENPNPGVRAGQIHLQDQATGAKYMYNPVSNAFIGAPNRINRLLNDPEIKNAIEKAMRFLGETQ